MTAGAYEWDLDANIRDLADRLKTKRYRAKLVRRCYIPKDDGGQRPLGIPALEDKLVQLACAGLLNAIYEQDFLTVSYGYRPGRGAKDAVCDLGFNLQYGRKLQRSKRQIKEWVRANRHLPGPAFIVALNRRLVGHYNYFGPRGNLNGLYRFYDRASACAFKRLNRRGGKRSSFTWGQFDAALKRMGVARPPEYARVTEEQRQHVVFP